MVHHCERQPTRVARLLAPLVLLAVLGLLGLGLLPDDETQAQTVNTPIPRQVVARSAEEYCYYPWNAYGPNVAGRDYTYCVCPECIYQETYHLTSAYASDIYPEIGVAYKWGGGDFQP